MEQPEDEEVGAEAHDAGKDHHGSIVRKRGRGLVGKGGKDGHELRHVLAKLVLVPGQQAKGSVDAAKDNQSDGNEPGRFLEVQKAIAEKNRENCKDEIEEVGGFCRDNEAEDESWKREKNKWD